MSTSTGPQRLDGVEPVFHVNELAQHLDITRQTAYRMIRDGEIRSIRIGRAVRIPESAIAEYLSGNKAS
jgi:excisionase family DNA binding protein